MSITNRDVHTLFQAITATDGYPDVVTVGGQDKVINKHYHIPAAGRVILARNHAALKPIVDGLSKAHDAIIREIAGDDEATGLPPESAGRFQKEWDVLLDEPADVTLITCKQDALVDTQHCDLPATLLSPLLTYLVAGD